MFKHELVILTINTLQSVDKKLFVKFDRSLWVCKKYVKRTKNFVKIYNYLFVNMNVEIDGDSVKYLFIHFITKIKVIFKR